MKKILFSIFLFAPVLSYAQLTGFFRQDLLLHAAAGYTISSSVTAVLHRNGVRNAELYGVTAGFAAGVGKEIYDQKRGGYFDPADMYYTMAGTVIGAAISTVLIEGARDRERKKKRKPNPLLSN